MGLSAEAWQEQQERGIEWQQYEAYVHHTLDGAADLIAHDNSLLEMLNEKIELIKGVKHD